MRTTLIGVSNTILSKAGLDKLRSGDIITIKIIKNKNGLIKASIKGKLITLKGDSDLLPGKFYRVKGLWNGKKLFLQRLDKQNPATDVFGSKAFSENESSLLFSAAKRAGLHLTEQNVKLLKRLFRKNIKLSHEKARVAVEAVKKGLEPEEMIALVDNEEKSNDGKNEKQKLFNQLKNRNELWYIVPYSFGIDGMLMKGSLRINKNTMTGKYNHVVIETDAFENRIFFLISNYSSENRILKIFSENPLGKEIKNRIIDGLPEILGNLSIKFDDNIRENCFEQDFQGKCFDGFSLSENTIDHIEEFI